MKRISPRLQKVFIAAQEEGRKCGSSELMPKKGREYEVYKHIPQRGTLTYTDVVHNDFSFLTAIRKRKLF